MILEVVLLVVHELVCVLIREVVIKDVIDVVLKIVLDVSFMLLLEFQGPTGPGILAPAGGFLASLKECSLRSHSLQLSSS